MAILKGTKISVPAIASYAHRLQMLAEEMQTLAAALKESGLTEVIAYEAGSMDKSLQLLESAKVGIVRGWTDGLNDRQRQADGGYERYNDANGKWVKLPLTND